MSPKKRRRTLALPFLITIASSSCTVQTSNTPRHQPVNPNVRQSGQHNTTDANHPPALRPTHSDRNTDQPAVSVNPPAPRPIAPVTPRPTAVGPNARPTGPNARPIGPNKNVGTTGPTVLVNPPAPPSNKPRIGHNKPKAPTTTGNSKLADAPKNGKVFTRKDGSCWWSPTVDCSDKTRTCNPPPPRRVKCAK